MGSVVTECLLRMATKRRPLRGFDLKQIEGISELIGVDEAGRGALAGPVVAGAVLVTRTFLDGRWAAINAGRINDSKQRCLSVIDCGPILRRW